MIVIMTNEECKRSVTFNINFKEPQSQGLGENEHVTQFCYNASDEGAPESGITRLAQAVSHICEEGSTPHI